MNAFDSIFIYLTSRLTPCPCVRQFAKSNGLEFLPMRVWIAMWMLLISLVVVGLEGSVLVRKFTRFTTEIFSSLVSILFVFESLSKLATVS